MLTKQELLDARAQQLNVIDDILKTAKEANRSLTPEEQANHDIAVALIEGETGFDAEIARCITAENDSARSNAQEIRRTRYASVNVAVNGNHSVGAGITRNLDDLYWATADVVRAANGVSFNPVDQVIVRSNISDDGHEAPRIAMFQPQHHDAIRNFQKLVAEMAIVGTLVDEDANTFRKGFIAARAMNQYKDKWNDVLRAMDVDTSAEGIEWVPTGIGASVHEKVRAFGKIAPLFDRIQIPTNPWKWPIDGADLVAYRVAEPTSDTATKVTASTAGTAGVTFDAEIFGVRTLWSKSLDVDSAIAIAPRMETKIAYAFAAGEEMAILDGDTDGTHQDADVGSSTTDARTAWDGLRKKAIAETVVTATSTTVANLLALRKGMGKWAADPSQCAYIVGVSAMHGLLADTTLLTVDKMGDKATILNGQIGSISGSPVIVSEFVRENLNASGVQDGITTSKTYNLCVRRSEWAIGQRMAIDVKVSDELYAETFQRVAVAFSREDFQSLASPAANDDTAIMYNVTP